jgi:protein TonB
MRRKPSVLLFSVVVHAVMLVVVGTAPWWSPIANWPTPREVLAFSEGPRLARLVDIDLPRPPRAHAQQVTSSQTAMATEPAPVVAATGVAPETAAPGAVSGPSGISIETPGNGPIEGVGLTSPPPAMPLPPPRAPEPVHAGGLIRPPAKVVHVAPQYPAAARAARVQGVVIVQATIDQLGNVESATILRSIPLLDQAALDAVRQWKFTPTLLNDVAVPVIMTVTVNFELSH